MGVEDVFSLHVAFGCFEVEDDFATFHLIVGVYDVFGSFEAKCLKPFILVFCGVFDAFHQVGLNGWVVGVGCFS